MFYHDVELSGHFGDVNPHCSGTPHSISVVLQPHPIVALIPL